MRNPTTIIQRFISLTFTTCYVTSQITHYDVQYLVGCSVNHSAVVQLALGGDEVFYVDFQRREVVFTPPPFLGIPLPLLLKPYHIFRDARNNAKICEEALAVMTVWEKHPPEQQEAPDSVLYPSEALELGVKNTLICYVRHFYPPSIQVSWSRNGEALSGASLSRFFPEEDGTFHQFSSLDIIPQQGDQYSCNVKHPALEQPDVTFWEPEKEEKDSSDVILALELTVGTLLLAAGLFFLVKSGRLCPPSEGVL